MKTLLMSLAVSAAAITSPAAAQYPSDGYQNRGNIYRDDDRAGANMAPRIEQMRVRIQAGVQSGAISRQEAVSLRANLRSLTQLERQYSRNGLTNQEQQELQRRLRALRQDVRRADGGANGRYDDWDRQNDRDEDRYDGRGYGTDGRWNDDDRDADDRQPPQRGGIGGLIDNVLGRNDATLQVGQRAPSNLYGVPYEYRDRYRDTNQSYYRSDGRQIYQIDARTQAVVRIHTMNR
jgi:Skp family chaperone for outer membrane proteins